MQTEYENRVFQIVDEDHDQFTAGSKAPADVRQIAQTMGFSKIVIPCGSHQISFVLLSKVIRAFILIWRVCAIPFKSIILVQFPEQTSTTRLGLSFLRLASRFKLCRVIVLIHDINMLREDDNSQTDSLDPCLNRIVSVSHVLIVHNAHMRTWLSQRGVSEDKMVDLGLFDYLTAISPRSYVAKTLPSRLYHNSVIVAGNLDPVKCGYVWKLGTVSGIVWNLYGRCSSDKIQFPSNVKYCGCFIPEELPAKLEGDFGLVWDGDSVDSCVGKFGNYLRYNNPHKLSMYLASGIPVIVWRESAVADLVEKEGVGIAVSSLKTLGSVLRGLDETSYERMRDRVQRLSEQVRRGDLFRQALRSAVLKCM